MLWLGVERAGSPLKGLNPFGYRYFFVFGEIIFHLFAQPKQRFGSELISHQLFGLLNDHLDQAGAFTGKVVTWPRDSI